MRRKRMFEPRTKLLACLSIIGGIVLYSNGLGPVKSLVPDELRQIKAANPWSIVAGMFDAQARKLDGGR
jgi:hypothetical protein